MMSFLLNRHVLKFFEPVDMNNQKQHYLIDTNEKQDLLLLYLINIKNRVEEENSMNQ